MKSFLLSSLFFILSLTVSAQYNIIPQPASMEMGDGFYVLPTDAAKIKVNECRDRSMPAEAYRLQVKPQGVVITACNQTGFFYGRQTLAQMIAQSQDGRLSCVTINDRPRFGYRGFMLDVVRTYMPLADIKKMVDVMAQLKLNTLHLHLTDDNGWRLEIKKYPKLTLVGAWRVDRPEPFPGRLNARSADEPATYGGFYTQKEMRELVKYCEARHINVLPEIEMPAHSAALLASYPELACPVVNKFIGVFPGIGGKDACIICCAGNEKVYQVYQDILDEVMAIFPSHRIHLGGDEANKAMWNKCPLCQAKIKEEGLRDSEALQGYFMDRINRYVRSHGREAIGWDEVTIGNPKEEITIMGWRGDGSAAVRDSRATGHKFILTPAKKLYLIRYQGPQWFEPFTYFGNNTLKDCYMFEPVGNDWDKTLEDNLMGVQGSMWNEFCPTAEDIQYMVFPRLVAIADLAWAPQGTKDWQGFLRGLDSFLPNLDRAGVTYSRSMYNLGHNVQPEGGKLRITLDCIRPDVEIRYANSEKALATGSVYNKPFTVDPGQTIYAATFKGGKQLGQTLQLQLANNAATAKSVKADGCTNGLAYTLVNGVRGRVSSDGEWAGWYNSNAEFVVDLGRTHEVNAVTLHALAHADVCIGLPKSVFCYTSTDGVAYTMLCALNTDNVFRPALSHVEYNITGLPTTARFLKFVAINPGCIPDGMAREGTPTWMYFDEVEVQGK